MCLGGVCTRMACGVISWRRKEKEEARSQYAETQQHLIRTMRLTITEITQRGSLPADVWRVVVVQPGQLVYSVHLQQTPQNCFLFISFGEVLQEPFCLSCNPKFILVNGSDGLHLHFIKWLKLLWAAFTFRFYFCISLIAGLQSFCSFQLTYKSSIDWNPVNRHMKLWLVMTAVSQKRHGGTKGEERPEENSVVPSSRNSWRHVMLKHGGRVQTNVCNII